MSGTMILEQVTGRTHGIVESLPRVWVVRGETKDGGFKNGPNAHDDVDIQTPFAHVERAWDECDIWMALQSAVDLR